MNGWCFCANTKLWERTEGIKKINYELCTDPTYNKNIQTMLQKQGWKKLSGQRLSDEEIYNNLYLFLGGRLDMRALSSRATRLQHHTVVRTFISDGCTVINNVFPLWAIKYFHSGSLGWSGELKGASTVVVEGWRIFGAQNFPSSLKQRRVATHHIQWCYYVCWFSFSSDIKYFSCFC